MKNIIIVTGGAGFVGSNLIEFLLKKTSYKIISLDNYSTGNKKNHFESKRIQYVKCDNSEINKVLWNITKKKEELINVAVHPTRKTIMLFIKSPYPSDN